MGTPEAGDHHHYGGDWCLYFSDHAPLEIMYYKKIEEQGVQLTLYSGGRRGWTWESDLLVAFFSEKGAWTWHLRFLNFLTENAVYQPNFEQTLLKHNSHEY